MDHPSDQHPHHPPRRAFLEWAIYGMNAAVGVVLGAPIVAYLIDARNRAARDTSFRTVCRLSELPLGEPREFVIKETRTDAWNLHPDDVVGRIWVIRNRPGAASELSVFTTICPHLGCSVNWTERGEFLCPCHGGRFTITG